MLPKFDKRLFSYIIDLLISIGVSIFIYFAFKDSFILFKYLSAFIWIEIISIYFFSLINGLICLITNGYTLGSLILGIKTVSISQERLSVKQVFLKFLPLSIVPLVIINAFYMLYVHTEVTIFDNLSKTTSVLIR